MKREGGRKEEKKKKDEHWEISENFVAFVIDLEKKKNPHRITAITDVCSHTPAYSSAFLQELCLSQSFLLGISLVG